LRGALETCRPGKWGKENTTADRKNLGTGGKVLEEKGTQLLQPERVVFKGKGEEYSGGGRVINLYPKKEKRGGKGLGVRGKRFRQYPGAENILKGEKNVLKKKEERAL